MEDEFELISKSELRKLRENSSTNRSNNETQNLEYI